MGWFEEELLRHPVIENRFAMGRMRPYMLLMLRKCCMHQLPPL